MVLTSSENMEQYDLLQTGSTWKAGHNEIFDADGDGVEDNVDYTHGELDNFFFPTVFNTAEDVYNTRHGNYPGHRQKEFYDMQSPPESMELVKREWKKWWAHFCSWRLKGPYDSMKIKIRKTTEFLSESQKWH